MTRHPARVAVLAAMAVALASSCGAGAPDASGAVVEIPGLGATRVDVPRPTTQAGAGCVPALPDDETVAERAIALRGLGLFAEHGGRTDASLGDLVENSLAETWGETFTPDTPYLELIVAAVDDGRVWWGDLEADVSPGNNVYVDTLEGWASISEGSFEPTAIEETWDGERATIAVTLEGEELVLTPEPIDDWIDPRIATPINERIAKSGRELAFVQAFDQTAFVMALTEHERAAFEARGWCFE